MTRPLKRFCARLATVLMVVPGIFVVIPAAVLAWVFCGADLMQRWADAIDRLGQYGTGRGAGPGEGGAP